MPDRWIRDHIGDETSPRPDFETELAETLRAAWQSGEEPPARVALDPADHPPRRRRWPIVAGLGTVAALLAVLTAIAIARDDGTTPAAPTPTSPLPVPTAPTATPAPPVTTAAPTTSLPPTSEQPPASTGPTTVPAPTPVWVPTENIPTDSPEGFFPACAERRGLPAPTDITAPPSFGPLSDAAALTILLPASVDPADYPANQRITSPRGTATLIPGGVLVALNQANGTRSSLLAAVNLDGTIRWVRCTDADQIVSPYDLIGSNAAGAEAFVRLRDPDELGDPPPNWVQVDLETGEFGATLSERLAERNPSLDGARRFTVVGQSRTHLLLASYGVLSGQDDVLLLVDRSSLIAEQLPGAGASTDNLQYPSLDESGRPVLTVGTPSGQRVVAVYADGVWITDVGRLAAPSVRLDYDPQTGRGTPRVVDGAGDEIWRRDDLVAWTGEGFFAAVAGDVTVARVCTDYPGCNAWAVVGLRTADGEEVWRLDAPAAGGMWGVGPIGTGVALVQEPTTFDASGTASGGAWIMVETATGQPVAGQRWDDPTTFEAQCCGGGVFVHVTRVGGVVVAVNERRITVWFPAGTGLAPATTSLP